MLEYTFSYARLYIVKTYLLNVQSKLTVASIVRKAVEKSVQSFVII